MGIDRRIDRSSARKQTADIVLQGAGSSGGGSSTMTVHVALLAVPAVAAGFLQAFQFAFLLWPFNLALPLARHLPRACIALRGVASFYDAELRRYAGTAARAAVPGPVQRRIHRYASLRDVQQRTHGDAVVAHAMVALVDISY